MEIERQSQNLISLISDINTRLFYAVLVFMAKRRDLFSMICADINHQGVLYRMTEILYSRLEITWLPKGSATPVLGSERTDMLIRVLVEVFCKWSISTNCNVRKADRYIRRLLRATTDAAENRLP